MSEKLPKGFTCECGEFHKFGFYVYAHENDSIIHTCPKCEREHEIRHFTARLIEPKRKAKKSVSTPTL
jgi:hypothetical protein